MKGIQYNPFHKKQLLLLPLHPLQARFPFGIGNGVNGISDMSAHVTKCDIEVQLESTTLSLLNSILSLYVYWY